jgi:hypothetical protein
MSMVETFNTVLRHECGVPGDCDTNAVMIAEVGRRRKAARGALGGVDA